MQDLTNNVAFQEKSGSLWIPVANAGQQLELNNRDPSGITRLCGLQPLPALYERYSCWKTIT